MPPPAGTPAEPQRKRSRWLEDDDDAGSASDDDRRRAEQRSKKKARQPDHTGPLAVAASPARPTMAATSATQPHEPALPVPPPPPPVSRLLASPPPLLSACRSVDRYEKLNRIDEGSYGIVYRARDRDTGEIVALKRLKLDNERHGFPVTALREIHTLMLAMHPHIVNVREIVVGSSLTSIFIVMDFVEHELKSLLASLPHPFLASEIKTLALQLLSAVAHLHQRHIIHRDLKTSNLLLTNTGLLKVADFGLARQFSDATGVDGGRDQPERPMTALVVTLWYRAPELLLGCTQYAAAVDVWSAGCIIAELVLRQPLFPGRGEVDQIDRIFGLLGRPPSALTRLKLAQSLNLARFPQTSQLHAKLHPHMSSAGCDLVSKMLCLDPAERITAAEALEHPYFKKHPPPKDPALFPTFPSKASGETRRRDSPAAPVASHGGVLGSARDAPTPRASLTAS